MYYIGMGLSMIELNEQFKNNIINACAQLSKNKQRCVNEASKLAKYAINAMLEAQVEYDNVMSITSFEAVVYAFLQELFRQYSESIQHFKSLICNGGVGIHEL
jgi:cyclopropane fatty-acyl-phospholipid synthase-like methyltransferase